jgi:hypothetical protein
MVARPSAEEATVRDDADAVGMAAAGDRRMSGSAPEGLQDGIPARARIISPSLMLPAEVVIFEIKPSLWYAALASLPVVAAGAAMVALAFAIRELPLHLRTWAVVIGVSVIGFRITFGLLQWLGRTYVLTDRRVLMQYGVLSVQVECLGLEEIENTFVAQAAGQRVLGIGTIFFRCNASHRNRMAWEHVREPKEIHAQIVVQIDRWKHALMGPQVP